MRKASLFTLDKMLFVYQLVPENMKGKILYPLNILKTKYPNIYRNEIKKYEYRKNILKTKIPLLNCRWGDVLYLVAVHPSKIKKALMVVGFKLPKLRWYKIDANNLIKKNTVIYLYKNETFKKENFVKYSPEKLSKYNKISIKTKRYYSEEFRKGNKPLLFAFVPHILYKGALNVRDAEIIEI